MSNSCNPMACSLPGSSVHGILQARILDYTPIKKLNFKSFQMQVNIREVWMVGRGLWWEPDSSLISRELFRKHTGRSSSPSSHLHWDLRGAPLQAPLGKRKKSRKNTEWFDEKTEFFLMCLVAHIAYRSNEGPKNVKAVPETSRKHHKDFPLLSINHEGETEEGFRAQAEISWLGATTSKGTTPSGKAEHGNTERHGRCGIGQVKRQHKGSFHHNASVLWRESEYMWIPLDLA